MARCLITGIAGFIGSAIATALVDRGHMVSGIDDFSTGKQENLAAISTKITLFEGDIRDQALLDRACEDIDYIFHEAAVASVQKCLDDPRGTQEINVEGTVRLINAAAHAGVRRLIFASSSAIYGEAEILPIPESAPCAPMSPYATHKLQCEFLLKTAGLEVGLETVCLRYFNVFGPRQAADSPYSGVIASFVAAMSRGSATHPVTIYGDGLQTRDFIYIDTVVAANIAAMTAPAGFIAGTSLNIGSGEQRSIAEAARTISRLTGYTGPIKRLPARKGDLVHSVADISLAKRILGLEPTTSFQDGLALTVNWLQRENAKRHKHRIHAAANDGPEAARQHTSAANVLRAIENNEFSLVYQPIIDIASQRISGVEALLRHVHEGGTGAPLRLIRIAETTGAIVDLGRWVLGRACEEARHLQAALGPKLRISVNISAPQLDHPSFIPDVQAILAASALHPSTLELEITERVLISNARHVRATMRRLQDIGVGIALDDFGAGHANLQHLCHLRVDRLKTDRSVLRGSTRRWPLFDGVVAFAQEMHLPVVAEGIESAPQLEKVRRSRCLEGQGMFISHPLRLDQLLEFTPAASRLA